MAGRSEYDAIVVGAGPNGLLAAITMAEAGRRVVVFEAGPTPGGGCRTAELTEPGFRHDVCSAIHPLGIASAALRDLPLEEHGVRWRHPKIPLAHPLDGGAALLHRSLDDTVAGLGADGATWRRLMTPLTEGGLPVVDEVMAPLSLPRHPLRLARFGLDALRPATSVGRRRFDSDRGAALFAGLAAHSILALDRPLTTGVGLFLGGLAHVVGLAVRRRWLAGDHRRARGDPAVARRRGRLRPPRRRPRRVAQRAGGAGRRHAAPAHRHGRRPLPAARSAALGDASATDRACSSSTTPSPSRCRGRIPPWRCRHRAPRRHARRRLRPPKRAVAGVSTRTRRSCSWPSSRRSTPAGRRPASTRCGPTATCRPARRST